MVIASYGAIPDRTISWSSDKQYSINNSNFRKSLLAFFIHAFNPALHHGTTTREPIKKTGKGLRILVYFMKKLTCGD